MKTCSFEISKIKSRHTNILDINISNVVFPRLFVSVTRQVYTMNHTYNLCTN